MLEAVEIACGVQRRRWNEVRCVVHLTTLLRSTASKLPRPRRRDWFHRVGSNQGRRVVDCGSHHPASETRPGYDPLHLRWPMKLLLLKPGIERVQALADISHLALCCRCNETRAPIANPPNSAQLEGTPTIPPSYIRIRAVVWECDEGQTNRHTDGCDQYTFHLSYASREM